MTTSLLHRWVNESPDRTRIYAQESLIVDVSEAIWAAMEAANLSKAELAEKLGVSKSHVTQLLSGSRNLTLRSLADIAAAMGLRVCVKLLRHHESDAWQSIDAVFHNRIPVALDFIEPGNDSQWGAEVEVRAA